MPLPASLLIANRGEIACRIIATAKQLGVRTIAVYSQADAKNLHVVMADEAHNIGASIASESYLDISKIITVAKLAKAEAIHPGYGFLSERAEFAQACKDAGIIFIGPPASAIRAMGSKDEAKRLMEKTGVPIVPGYHGENQDSTFLKIEAKKIGYPILIKAVAGGGGKGMRRVDHEKDFNENLAAAQREAKNAFSDERVLVEKYIINPRHIEIQIFADSLGHAVYLFERDCSLQRRHQKVLEEAPAPGMSEKVREAMGQAAIAAAKAVGYVGAGTVEFIADCSSGLKADGFYFMEMNTRLQVEHPVTEAICGVDLVEWQLRIAAGEALPLQQKDLKINGHAIEARLYAEDPQNGFLPSSGKIWHLAWPRAAEFKVAQDELRIDTGVRQGDTITPHYDPMIAKVIAHGATRDEALDKLAAGLSQIKIAGPKTNLAFLKSVIAHDDFRKAKFDTGFIDKNLETLISAPQTQDVEQIALNTLLKIDRPKRRIRQSKNKWQSPWKNLQKNGCLFQSAPMRELSYVIEFESEEKTLSRAIFENIDDIDIFEAGDGIFLLKSGQQFFARWPDPQQHMNDDHAQGVLKAPMNGKVTLVQVKEGDYVKSGDRLLVIEAMKMEHAIITKKNGRVMKILKAVGEQVQQGAPLIEVGEA
jgi:3-methylcrotonyl-CoA carboxylase alpha subunit